MQGVTNYEIKNTTIRIFFFPDLEYMYLAEPSLNHYMIYIHEFYTSLGGTTLNKS